jgi:hypothetical protein
MSSSGSAGRASWHLFRAASRRRLNLNEAAVEQGRKVPLALGAGRAERDEFVAGTMAIDHDQHGSYSGGQAIRAGGYLLKALRRFTQNRRQIHP